MSVHEPPGAVISRRMLAERIARDNGLGELTPPEEPEMPEPPEDHDGGTPQGDTRTDGVSAKGPSQATRLVQLATEQYELGVTPDGESENSAANAATPHDDLSSLLRAHEETAANAAATLRQSPCDAAPPTIGAATAADDAPNAAPNAAPGTPSLTSGNEDHAATAANAALFPDLLCSRCQYPAKRLVPPDGLCERCAYPAGGAPEDDGDES